MAIPADFKNTIRSYGAISDSNKKQLEEWLGAAILSVASNGGAQVASASANGASFSNSLDGMTTAEWATVLTQALKMIELGLKSTSISFGSAN